MSVLLDLDLIPWFITKPKLASQPHVQGVSVASDGLCDDLHQRSGDVCGEARLFLVVRHQEKPARGCLLGLRLGVHFQND